MAQVKTGRAKKVEGKSVELVVDEIEALPSAPAAPVGPPPFVEGIWYVMKKRFSGWELYKQTPEVVAAAWRTQENYERVNYAVFGVTQTGGPTVCDVSTFEANIVRLATPEDVKRGPRETFA